MQIFGNLLTLLALCSSLLLCIATRTISFPEPVAGVNHIENRFIIEYYPTEEGTRSKQSIIDSSHEGIALIKEISTRNIYVVDFPSSSSAKNWLNDAKGVKSFDRDHIIYRDRPSKSDRQNQGLTETTPYGITHVNALQVSDNNAETRKVCLIDSGYDITHPDLPSDLDLITGESFVNGVSWDTDEFGDGTRAAGVIVALHNDQGVVGVIRNGLLKLHIAKIYGASGSAYYSEIIAAYESCVQSGANIILVNLNTFAPYTPFENVIVDAENDGILTFANSGTFEGGSSQYAYPASHPSTISVASINENYERSSFSVYNDEVNICAPGSNITTTLSGGGYSENNDGGWYAGAHAVGVAALVWSHYPTLSHDKLRNILEQTATDLGSDGYDVEFGHGLINAEVAFDAIVASFQPTVSPAPTTQPTLTFQPTRSLAPSTQPTDCDGELLTVQLNTDQYATETSWNIAENVTGIVVMNSALFLQQYFLYETTECLNEGCYVFEILDGYGDGICCTSGVGNFTVIQSDTVILSGGNFGSSDSVEFCVSRTKTPSHVPTLSLLPSVTVNPSNVPTLIPSDVPSTFPPTLIPSAQPTACNGGDLTVQLTTDQYYTETSWDVTENVTGIMVMNNGLLERDSDYETTKCLNEGCYVFEILDSYGDGICCIYGNGNFSVIQNDTVILSGSNFDSSARVDFCFITPSLSPSVTQNPSTVPSLSLLPTRSLSPSNAPTLSSLPTVTLNPSNAPSLRSSDLPSILPTTVPTSIPSDDPSALPSSLPTTVPSSVPSDNPSALPSLLPTIVPTLVPSEDTSTPCVDSSYDLVYTAISGGEYSTVNIDCVFVSDVSDCLCDDPNVSSHCPSTCNSCAEYKCVDSTAYWLTPKGNMVGCDFGAIGEYCEASEEVRMTCRATCGVCDTDLDVH